MRLRSDSARRRLARLRPGLRLAAAGLSVAAAPFTTTLAAQDLRTDCDPTSLDAATALADTTAFLDRVRFHPRATELRDSVLMVRDPVAALDTIRAAFAVDPALPGGHPWRRIMLRRLDAARDEVKSIALEIAATIAPNDTVSAALARSRLDQVSFKIQFSGPDVVLFQNSPDTLRISASSARPQRQAVCWAARRASRVLEHFVDPAYALTAWALQRVLRDWSAYDANGVSQYPWEAVINGRRWACPLPMQGPPTCQLLVLHPNVGYAVGAEAGEGDVASRIRGRQTLAVDVIGKVWYGNGWRRYRGFSVFALVGDRPLGAGVAWHFDRAIQVGGGVSVGPGGHLDRGVGYLSLDAYRFLSEMPAKLRERRDAVLRSVEDRIAHAKGGDGPAPGDSGAGDPP